MPDPFESVPATQPTSWPEADAPAAAEGLGERIAEIVTRWALMYPFANYGIWGTAAGASRDQLTVIAEDIAAGWGRDIADRVLAELAADPGDLPARMLAAIKAVRIRPELDPIVTSMIQAGVGFHLKDDEARQMVDVVMAVRWELTAQLTAENAHLRARAEHAESEHQVTQDRLAEVHAHRVTLMKALEDENNLRVRTEVELANLRGFFDAMTDQRDALKAARCPSCDHLAEHHQPGGCWYAVTTGAIDLNLVCPCTVPGAALDGGE